MLYKSSTVEKQQHSQLFLGTKHRKVNSCFAIQFMDSLLRQLYCRMGIHTDALCPIRVDRGFELVDYFNKERIIIAVFDAVFPLLL